MNSLESTFSKLTLKQLRQLIVISDCGSIRAASKLLFIAQPALSRSIRALEEQLGITLIERGTGGIQLTKFGDALLRHAKVIEASLRYATEEIDEMRGLGVGSIRIGIGPLEGYTIAYLAIDRLLGRHPEVEITIIEGPYDFLEAQLLSGKVDFILGPSTQDSLNHGLSWEILTHIRRVVAVRNRHPLARKKKPTLADLAGARWVTPRNGTLARARLDNVFLQHALTPPHSSIQAYSTTSATIVALVLQRDLVALLPRALIKHELRHKELKDLTIDAALFSTAVVLTQREPNRYPPACRELITEIRKVCKEIGASL